MKPLSDLLREAKGEAPPARFDVEDVVAAGRRLHRRRITGWAAVAAAVAVAVVVGVPRIVTHPEGRAPVLPAASTSPGQVYPGSLPFRGFAVEGYRVEDPRGASPSWSSSMVVDTDTGKEVGFFLYYTPDADVQETYGQGEWTEVEPIGGRPAFDLHYEEEHSLIWRFDDGAYAMLSPGEKPRIPAADLRRIAAGFEPGPGAAITTMVRAGYVPAGFRVDTIGGYGVTFQTGDVLEISPDRLPNLINIAVNERRDFRPAVTEPTCEQGSGCRRPYRGDYEVSVDGAGVHLDELRKVLDSVTTADRDDPATWFVAHDAVPAHTLVQLG